jgi:3-methyladenine DNA glycosylase AlkD
MEKLTLNKGMEKMRAKARPDQLEGMARFAIVGEGRLGLSMPDIRGLAKEIGTNHELALQLWETKIPDARILAGIIDDPVLITRDQAESWAMDFDSWDVCDQVSGTLETVPFAGDLIREWAVRDEEFVKRAAFAIIAGIAWHSKTAPDSDFLEYLEIIKQAATDDRNFVRKAVNWALRNIGKRNQALNKAALAAAVEIKQLDSRAARWIAADAIRELTSDKIQARLLADRPRPNI